MLSACYRLAAVVAATSTAVYCIQPKAEIQHAVYAFDVLHTNLLSNAAVIAVV
jgi:hypothetical protein